MDIGKISTAIVIFIAAVVEVLIVFRLGLLLFAANSSAGFTEWIYSSTDSLVAPFAGVFPSISIANLITLELSSVLALLVYGVAAVILIYVLRMLEGTKVKGPKLQGNQNQPHPQQMPTQPPQQTYGAPPMQQPFGAPPAQNQQPQQTDQQNSWPTPPQQQPPQQ